MLAKLCALPNGNNFHGAATCCLYDNIFAYMNSFSLIRLALNGLLVCAVLALLALASQA
jgi:hypothetical protein